MLVARAQVYKIVPAVSWVTLVASDIAYSGSAITAVP